MTDVPWPVREAGGAAEFEADLPFTLDDFQVEAFDALDAGHSVLVSAPTGSGKTLVAAYAVHRALPRRGKAFYTTPLKALSNQKYGGVVPPPTAAITSGCSPATPRCARGHPWW